MLALAGCASSGPEDDEPVVAAPVIPEGVEIIGAPDGQSRDVRQTAEEFLAQFESTGGRAAYVDDAAYEIERLLLERGYAQADVRYEITGERAATITIEAGPRSTIGEVTVVADALCPLDEDLLRAYVNGPRPGLFGTGDMLYIEGRVARAASVVVGDLVALGHLDAEAEITDPGPGPEGGPVPIRLTVVARERYVVGGVDFEVSESDVELSSEASATVASTLESVVEDEDGEPVAFEPRLTGRLRSALEDAYGRAGHPDARVTVRADVERETKSVALAIRAEPGPEVTVTEVRIVSEGDTKESFVRKQLGVEPGATFDASELREGVRRLYRTGLFSEVRTRLEGTGDTRALVLEIEEAPSTDVYFEPGYGSYELFRATVGARNRNLFGIGINGSVEATVAVRALRFVVGLTDPRFFDSNLVADYQINFERREEPSFVRENIDVGAYLTREWDRRTYSTVGYRFGRSDADDIEVNDDSVDEVESQVNIASVFLSQRYDARDAIFAPSTGFLTEASAEIAPSVIGSELEFIRLRLSHFWFFDRGPDDVLGIGFRTGVILPAFGENEIPIQERFFAGGENSVRSFRESELGPRDVNGNPIGGEAMATLSLEWRHVLRGSLQSALFADAGFVEEDVSEYFGFDDVRYGIGAGLRYLLPIGPLRIDGAVNPDPRDFEDDWVIHFSIGMPF